MLFVDWDWDPHPSLSEHIGPGGLVPAHCTGPGRAPPAPAQLSWQDLHSSRTQVPSPLPMQSPPSRDARGYPCHRQHGSARAARSRGDAPSGPHSDHCPSSVLCLYGCALTHPPRGSPAPRQPDRAPGRCHTQAAAPRGSSTRGSWLPWSWLGSSTAGSRTSSCWTPWQPRLLTTVEVGDPLQSAAGEGEQLLCQPWSPGDCTLSGGWTPDATNLHLHVGHLHLSAAAPSH